MKSKKSFIIKLLLVLYLFLYLGFLYTADYAKDISIDSLRSYLEQNTAIEDMPVRNTADLLRYFNIGKIGEESFLFYKDLSPMSVNEVLVVKAKNKEQVELFLENAENHLADQKNIFSGYGTTQMGYLNAASIGSKGNYVYYFCGPESGSQYNAFLSQI